MIALIAHVTFVNSEKSDDRGGSRLSPCRHLFRFAINNVTSKSNAAKFSDTPERDREGVLSDNSAAYGRFGCLFVSPEAADICSGC